MISGQAVSVEQCSPFWKPGDVHTDKPAKFMTYSSSSMDEENEKDFVPASTSSEPLYPSLAAPTGFEYKSQSASSENSDDFTSASSEYTHLYPSLATSTPETMHPSSSSQGAYASTPSAEATVSTSSGAAHTLPPREGTYASAASGGMFASSPGGAYAAPPSGGGYISTPSEEAVSSLPLGGEDWSGKPLATPSPAEMPEMLCQGNMDVFVAKYEAKKEKIKEICSSHNVRILSAKENDKHKVVNISLEGTKAAVDQVTAMIKDEMKTLQDQKLKLNPVTARMLQGSAGKGAANRKLKSMKVQMLEVNGRLTIVGHKDDVHKAASMIENMFCRDQINVQDGQCTVMKTNTWKEAIRGVESDGCVVVKETSSSIQLEGIDHCVKESKALLLGTLKTNSFKTEHVDVKKGVFRFIKMHQRDEIDALQTK